eukprot:TRINITY_DN135042_c1_g1_i1.p1 TRINITY_DN135042_c1_g1~~TRINITY_DN135042_c1_g1_i1.p1  ORF type:complete len:780 (+),score=104.77 TRINITY_DN135042_c1_g1_i1:2383-4722(+)
MEDALRSKRGTARTAFHTTRSSIAPKAETMEEKTNKILKAKLLQFQHQNNANIENARKEIERLRNEIKTSEETNKKLIGEFESATRKLQQLMAAGYKVEKVEDKTTKYEMEEKARIFKEAQIVIRFFDKLRESVAMLKKERKLKVMKELRIKGKALHILKRNVLILKLIRYRAEIRNKVLQHKVVRGLQKHVEMQQKLSHFEMLRDMMLVRKVLVGFGEYPIIRQENKKKSLSARAHYSNTLKLKAINRLKEFARLYHMSLQDEQKFSKLSYRHYAKVLTRKAFIGLRIHYSIKRPQKEQAAKALGHYILILLKKSLGGLRFLLLIKQMREKKGQYYLLVKKKRSLKKCMMCLKLNLREQRKKRILNSISLKVQMKRMLFYWKKAWDMRNHERRRVNAIVEYSNAKLVRRVWKGFALHRMQKRRNAAIARAVFVRHLLNLRVTHLKLWIKKTREALASKQVRINNQRRIIQQCIKQWRKQYWHKLVEHTKDHFAEVLQKSLSRRLAKQVFRQWHKIVENEKILKNIAAKLCKKSSHTKKRAAFLLWLKALSKRFKHEIQTNLKTRSAELQAKNDATNNLLQHFTEECHVYEKELEEVRNKRADVTAELAGKEIALSQKETELIQKTQYCRDVQESIAANEEELQELENSRRFILDQYENQRKEHELAMRKLRVENQELVELVANSEDELKKKQEALVAAEKELMQIHSKGEKQRNCFEELEEITISNNKLMLELESKKKELAGLEQQLSMMVRENDGLKQFTKGPNAVNELSRPVFCLH